MKKPDMQRESSAASKDAQKTAGIISIRSGKIPHQQIYQKLRRRGDLVKAYRERVLSQKTRTISLLGRKTPSAIHHTLLGYEVQASYKRIHCPDIATARYVKLFSELGCHSIKLPYDPTLTSELIPEFERMIEDATAYIRTLFARDSNLQRYVIRRIFGILRSQLALPDSDY